LKRDAHRLRRKKEGKMSIAGALMGGSVTLCRFGFELGLGLGLSWV
jgi:hypothetical protein